MGRSRPSRRLAGRALLILPAIAVLTGLLPSQAMSAAAPPSPGPRDKASTAYDGARGRVVLFGGLDGDYLGDTWMWDGTAWTKATPKHEPPARGGSAMAYDVT